MEKHFVSELEPRQGVTSAYAVRSKSLAAFRNKPGQFLNVVLGDSTGDIPGRAWDNAEALAERFDAGDIVVAKGRVDEYQGEKQLIIEDVRRAEEGEFDPSDFLPRTERDVRQLWAQLEATIDEVRREPLRDLLNRFFGDSDFAGRFTSAPGAKALHHGFLGGLLEHTVAVAEVCKRVCELHPEVDRDILITAALLHDIGKLGELETGATIEYTNVGRLAGHTVLTDRWVTEQIEAIPDFPEQLADLLRHILLSHHGQREWGAPIVPMTIEACALHYADVLDARVQQFVEITRAEAGEGKSWSGWHKLLERYIYVGARTEPAETAPPPASDQGELTLEGM